VNPDGTLVVTTRSFISNATFGTAPNAIVINKVLVETKVLIAGGNATADAHVTVGSVTVNGQPVQLSDQGASYQEQTASCTPSQLPPPPALPGVAPPAGCRAASVSTASTSGPMTLAVWTAAPRPARLPTPPTTWPPSWRPTASRWPCSSSSGSASAWAPRPPGSGPEGSRSSMRRRS